MPPHSFVAWAHDGFKELQAAFIRNGCTEQVARAVVGAGAEQIASDETRLESDVIVSAQVGPDGFGFGIGCRATVARACRGIGGATARESVLQARVAALEVALRDLKKDSERLQMSVLPRASRYMEFRLKDLLADSSEFRFVTRLVEDSVDSHRVFWGQPDFAPAPRLRTLSVEKILNIDLLEQYQNGLSMLEGKRRVEGCGTVGELSDWKVHPQACGGHATDLNEHFGLHGATEEAVQKICRFGFDPQRAGEGAGRFFGAASYFAVNASKSDIYTDQLSAGNRYPRSAPRKLIVARLSLGKCARVDECRQSSLRAPENHDSAWAAKRSEGGCLDHREVMIYNHQHALPLFVVTYKHECPSDALCAECIKRPAR